jgi:hypothetical protein
LVFSKASLDATVARLDESGAAVEADTDDDESEVAAAEAS